MGDGVVGLELKSPSYVSAVSCGHEHGRTNMVLRKPFYRLGSQKWRSRKADGVEPEKVPVNFFAYFKDYLPTFADFAKY